MKQTLQNRKGLKLVVVVDIAQNPKGLVFIEHGLGGFKEQTHIQAMKEVFLEEGISTVVFDTSNSIGESEGKYEDATLGTSYEDMEDVIEWSKSQPWYQAPFFITGHSMGAYSALQFAENYPELIKGVFAFAPVVSGKLSWEATERFESEKLKMWKEIGWVTRTSNSKPGIELRLPWSHMEERLEHDLLPKAGNLTMPVLFVVGEKDQPCPPDHQQILYEAIPGPKEIIIVPDAPHTFKEGEHLRILKESISKWLKKLLD